MSAQPSWASVTSALCAVLVACIFRIAAAVLEGDSEHPRVSDKYLAAIGKFETGPTCLPAPAGQLRRREHQQLRGASWLPAHMLLLPSCVFSAVNGLHAGSVGGGRRALCL